MYIVFIINSKSIYYGKFINELVGNTRVSSNPFNYRLYLVSPQSIWSSLDAIDLRHGQEIYMTFKHGAAHGAFLGLFVVLPVLATNATFEMKSAKYIFINVFYWIVSLALMGGALNGWPV